MDAEKVFAPSNQPFISLSPIGLPVLELLRDVLESWNGKHLDESLLARLAEDKQIGFLSHILTTNLNPIPFRSLLRIVLKRFGGNMAILEDPYLEMEFWDTYAYFHSRSFLSRRKHCWRLHFFRLEAFYFQGAPESLVDLLYKGATQENIEGAGFKYLGFATIRPTSSFSLGRTAVPFDERRPKAESGKASDPVEAEGRPYCKGKAPQVANICATKMCLDTVPFLQQDPVVGMCATASLWVASQVLASKFDLHKYPYIDISRQATQPSLAPFIATPPDNYEDFARGLSVPQICGALLRTGAVPMVIAPKMFSHRSLSHAHIHDQLYTFVESELPVIVCLTRKGKKVGHAVTAVGHWQPDIHRAVELRGCEVSAACPNGSSSHYLVSLAVKRFSVHNDNYGPYDRLDFLRPDELPPSERTAFTCPVRLSQSEDKTFDVQALVVPVPPYVKNRPDFVLQGASVRFVKLFSDDGFQRAGLKVLWRVLLVKGSRFKQSLRERKWPEPLIQAYAKTHLPKYVWLCELTVFRPSEVAQCLGASVTRQVHGEFVFDTTTAHYTTHAVVQRFGPYFITNDRAHSLEGREKARCMAASRLDGVSFAQRLECFTGSAQS